MRKFSPSFYLLIMWLALGGTACLPSSPDPTPEDQAALETLQSQFGDRYDFAFQYDVYLRARSRLSLAPTREEAIQIVEIFRLHAPSEPISFDEKGRMRNNVRSHIVYFNFHDRAGRFLFQVYKNPRNSTFEFSEQQFQS